MIGAYIRVSSQLQSENDSVANQRARAKSASERFGESVCYYEDTESGGKASRKNWMRLKADIEAGKLSIVWANENDRLGRNLREALAFWDLCESQKIRLIVGQHEVDYTSDSDFLQYGFASLISESDRRKIIKKTRETKAVVINDGRMTYRQLYGYDCRIIGANRNRPLREWFVVESEEKAIKDIYKWYLEEKLPVVKICQRLNDRGDRTKNGKYFASLTVYHILHQIAYTGKVLDKAGNLIVSKIYKKEIVSLNDFMEVQKRWEKQTTEKSFRIGRPRSHLASGLLRCGHCGTGYFFHFTTPPNGHSYVHNNGKNCPNNKMVSYQVMNWYLDGVYHWAMSENPKEIYNRKHGEYLKDKAELNESIKTWEKALIDLNKKIKRLIDAIEARDDDALVDRLAERQAERKQIEARLYELTVGLKKEEEKISVIVANFSDENKQRYKAADEKDRMIMLREIVESLIIKDDLVKVKLIDGREKNDDYQEIKVAFRRWQKMQRIRTKYNKYDTSNIRRVIEKEKIIDNIDGNDTEWASMWQDLLRHYDDNDYYTDQDLALILTAEKYFSSDE